MSSSGELERYGIRYAVERSERHARHWYESARKLESRAQSNLAEHAAKAWGALNAEARAAVGFLIDDASEPFVRRCADDVQMRRGFIADEVESLRHSHEHHPHDPLVRSALESAEEADRVGADIAGYVRSRTLVEGVGP